MSTIGGLYLPQIQPFDLPRTTTQAINAAGGMVNTQTALLALQDAKRQQDEAAAARAFLQQHPEYALGGAPQSTLASLAPAPGGPPGGGPMPALGPNPVTQQAFAPGQPPGAPQVVPGGRDLSRFAGQGGPGASPTPVLASLGPQPQAQAPNPQQRLLELARTNPEAALKVQALMQGQQDAQLQREERRLSTGTKVLEYVGRQAQGVSDQTGLDAMRQQLVALNLGQYAAQLPQVYSKEAMAPFIAKAVDVKDSLLLKVEDLKAQSAYLKAQREQANIPNYTGDAQLDALIYTRMKDQPAGTIPSREIVEDAYQQRERDKLNVSERQGVQAAEIERTHKPLEGAAGKDAANLQLLRTMTDDIAALRTDAYTGPIVGRTGYLREQAGQMEQQETAFRSTLQNMKDILGRLRSGANIPAPEMANLEKLLPTVNDLPGPFQAKMQSFQRALEQQLDSITRVGTTGRQQLREETTPTTPRVGAKPTSQAPAGGGAPAGGKVASEADIATTMQKSGKSRQDVLDALKAKGYTLR